MIWNECTLGDVLRVKHGFAFKSVFFEDEGPYVVLTPGNFFEAGGFRSRLGKDRSYSGEFPEDYLLSEGNVIIAMTEQGPGLLGSSAVVPEDGRYLHNQRIGLLQEVDHTKVDEKFLYYLFNTRGVRGQINGSATGTKVRHTAPERIYRVNVSLPSVNEQKRIVSVLSTYDGLIENNRRRIALLEEAARLLYREWFIHFRFPGHAHVKIVDGVPEGWELAPFSQLAEYLNGFAFKPRHLGEHGLPIVKIPELKGGTLSKTPRYEGQEVPEKYLLETGDLIFSWSGTLAVDFWVCGQAYLNQHLFKVTPTGRSSAAFILIAIRESMPKFMNQSVGATMKHIRRSALSDVSIALPPAHILDDFQSVLDNQYAQVRALRQHNMRLAEARDLLLPRLMDGRLEI
ncbi:MAG: restriction endonuclease subunit S [Rhodobacteraceae bacterium]|nr:MAG: restriction endonuclease subunit S [Paracoccaceae bacterium]